MKKLLFFLIIFLFESPSFGQIGGNVSSSYVTIKESDGSPTGRLKTLNVTNGTLTNNGSGSFTLTTGAGSGTGGGSCFEEDSNDDLEPVSSTCTDTYWELDSNTDIMPQE